MFLPMGYQWVSPRTPRKCALAYTVLNPNVPLMRINNEIFLNRNKYVVFSIEIQFPEFLPPLF